MEKPQIIEHSQQSVNYTLFGAKWVPASARFVLFGQQTKGTGTLQVAALRDDAIHVATSVCCLAHCAVAFVEVVVLLSSLLLSAAMSLTTT